MSFSILWEAEAALNRSANRDFFRDRFWSANQINFNPFQMIQRNEGAFKGRLAIARFTRAQTLSPFGEINATWSLGGVMEAMFVGINFPDVVREHRQVMALGSLGPTRQAPKCDIMMYCPMLFVFSEHKDASISLGIERIELREKSIFVTPDMKILAFRNQLI